MNLKSAGVTAVCFKSPLKYSLFISTYANAIKHKGCLTNPFQSGY